MKQVALQAATTKGNKRTVFLQMAEVGATGEKGSASTTIFFDGCSQRSFITEELSQKLGCRFLGSEKLTIGVFGGHEE